jgi:preprotein translocase subunit SecD
VNNGTLQEAVSIIQRRVDTLGVANSSVQREGKDVVISLPGIKDPQSALNVLGSTAQLFFRPVLCEIPNYAAPTTSTTTGSATTTTLKGTPTTVGGTTATTRPTTATTTPATSATTRAPSTATTTPAAASTPASQSQAVATAACSSAKSSSIQTTPIAQDTAGNYVILPDRSKTFRYVLGPADNNNGKTPPNGVSWVKSASAVPPGQNGPAWSVVVNFNSAGNTGFNKVAAARYPNYSSSTQTCTNGGTACLEAIELDGLVESAPQIQAATFAGSASITGSTRAEFTSKTANDLAVELRDGTLPVRFTPQQVQTVSATVGKDSLHAGLVAGIVGLIVVLLYMILYYRALGIVVIVGLAVGGALLYSIITALSQSANLALTLSGVTGIIVSIGITVDSYVVYFERLKDEVRAGRTIRQSVERGFARAFRTVLTADFVTILAAVVLWFLTVGDVKGFAFMLGLSTLLDVFTAYFFIRPAVILLGRHRTFTDARFLGIARGLGSARSATS